MRTIKKPYDGRDRGPWRLPGAPLGLSSGQGVNGDVLPAHPGAELALALDDNGVLAGHPGAEMAYATGTNGQRAVLTLDQSDSAHATN
jgi:hypothetical protein